MPFATFPRIFTVAGKTTMKSAFRASSMCGTINAVSSLVHLDKNMVAAGGLQRLPRHHLGGLSRKHDLHVVRDMMKQWRMIRGSE